MVRWRAWRQGVVSWFEFIDFRCDIVVVSLFGGHPFLGKSRSAVSISPATKSSGTPSIAAS
jgi:hypothetical protein